MAPDDDGYGDEDEAPLQQRILVTAAQGLALKTGRMVSHSSDVYRDTHEVSGASNPRDTALAKFWAALGRYILSPFISFLSTIFGRQRIVHNSSSFQFVDLAEPGHALHEIKPEIKLAISEVEVAPEIILGSLSAQDFRFITSLRYIEEH